MSALAVFKPNDPQDQPAAKKVSAADLLAGATKKGKASSHLVYTGEAGREEAARWLQLGAKIDESERELALLRNQVFEAVRPWHEETCARRRSHEGTVLVETPAGTVRVSFQDRYTKLSIDQEAGLQELLGADYPRYFKRTVSLKVKKAVSEDPVALEAMVLALAEKLGAENFASLFEVEQSLTATTAYTESSWQLSPEKRAALNLAGVRQVVAMAAK